MFLGTSHEHEFNAQVLRERVSRAPPPHVNCPPNVKTATMSGSSRMVFRSASSTDFLSSDSSPAMSRLLGTQQTVTLNAILYAAMVYAELSPRSAHLGK